MVLGGKWTRNMLHVGNKIHSKSDLTQLNLRPSHRCSHSSLPNVPKPEAQSDFGTHFGQTISRSRGPSTLATTMRGLMTAGDFSQHPQVTRHNHLLKNNL
jgi:hypothetical protein